MCGIALILGPDAPAAPEAPQAAAAAAATRPGAAAARFRRMLAALAPRGEVCETASGPGLLAGTQRLRIVDRDAAVQPWTFSGGRHVLCYNGELFNYRDLAAQLAALGAAPAGAGDTAALAAAFGYWGESAVSRFRGEFAFAVADTAARRVYLARDPLGVKPLYWARAGGALHVASEVKALTGLGAPVHEVPPGHHGWASPSAGPDLVPYTLPGGLPAAGGAATAGPPLTDPAEAAKLVRAAFEDSVRVRVDTDLTVGVILSGGLDSSLTLLHVAQMHPDCVAFTIGAPGSDDLRYARRLCADLGVAHEVLELPPRAIGLRQIRAAVRMAELTEPGDIINAVVSVPLFARVRAAGVKVVLTGDGSDELFGGYGMYRNAPPDQVRRLFLHKITNLARTELQRVDRTSMGHAVEARVPFLDPALVDLGLRLPMSLKLRDGEEKWILREAFAGLLPRYIRERPKNPMSHSSGLHERARLYKPLFGRIHRYAGYERHAAVRRDFSLVLESCGHDLDRALADLAARPGYTAAELARDLAGAVRWNARAAVGRRAPGTRARA